MRTYRIIRAFSWALPVAGSLLGAGCGGQPEQGGASNSSLATRLLREHFPEQAPLVLQQEHSFRASERSFNLKDPGAEGTWRSIEAEWPSEAQGQVRFRLLSGLEVRVREIGAEGAGQIVEQALVYSRPGGRSYWVVAAGGYEEWLHLEANAVQSTAAVAVWDIEGARVRQAEDGVEVVDGADVVQMRVTAPAAYAAGGRQVKARLAGEGKRIELFVEADGEEVLVDPLWVSGASMATTRRSHSAAVLADGKVLVAGGHDASSYHASAEVYNPSTNAWSTKGSMSAGRTEFGMALLGNNKVLVAGGRNPFSNPSMLLSAELYDPAAGTWSSAGVMSVSRKSFTMTPLSNGNALVAGGFGSAGFTASVQIYDSATNTWTAAASMATSRQDHAATLLSSGKVLVMGGYNVTVHG